MHKHGTSWIPTMTVHIQYNIETIKLFSMNYLFLSNCLVV